MRRPAILALLVLAALAAPAAAQEAGGAPASPGYFPFDELDILDPDDLELEINLHAPMLRVVAAAVRRSDPDFAELVAHLESVRVRIAPLGKTDPQEVRAAIQRAGRWLQERGWQTIVRSRDGDELVHVYLREIDGQIVGIAVLAIDGDDKATVLNIAGPIDLAQLVNLGERFDIALLGELEIGDGEDAAGEAPEKKPDGM